MTEYKNSYYLKDFTYVNFHMVYTCIIIYIPFSIVSHMSAFKQ